MSITKHIRKSLVIRKIPKSKWKGNNAAILSEFVKIGYKDRQKDGSILSYKKNVCSHSKFIDFYSANKRARCLRKQGHRVRLIAPMHSFEMFFDFTKL